MTEDIIPWKPRYIVCNRRSGYSRRYQEDIDPDKWSQTPPHRQPKEEND